MFDYAETIDYTPSAGTLDYGFALSQPSVSFGAVAESRLNESLWHTTAGYIEATWMKQGLKDPEAEPLTEEKWKDSEYYRDGLEYVDGMNTTYAERLALEHDLAQERKYKIENYEGGFISSAGLFAVDLAAQAMAPENAAFLIAPQIGLGASIGKAAAIGAAENFGIVALTEPLVYEAHKEAQLDYTLHDSLTALWMAPVFGGLLAGGGAAVGKVLKRFSRADKALKERAINDALRDKPSKAGDLAEAEVNNSSIETMSKPDVKVKPAEKVEVDLGASIVGVEPKDVKAPKKGAGPKEVDLGASVIAVEPDMPIGEFHKQIKALHEDTIIREEEALRKVDPDYQKTFEYHQNEIPKLNPYKQKKMEAIMQAFDERRKILDTVEEDLKNKYYGDGQRYVSPDVYNTRQYHTTDDFRNIHIDAGEEIILRDIDMKPEPVYRNLTDEEVAGEIKRLTKEQTKAVNELQDIKEAGDYHNPEFEKRVEELEEMIDELDKDRLSLETGEVGVPTGEFIYKDNYGFNKMENPKERLNKIREKLAAKKNSNSRRNFRRSVDREQRYYVDNEEAATLLKQHWTYRGEPDVASGLDKLMRGKIPTKKELIAVYDKFPGLKNARKIFKKHPKDFSAAEVKDVVRTHKTDLQKTLKYINDDIVYSKEGRAKKLREHAKANKDISDKILAAEKEPPKPPEPPKISKLSDPQNKELKEQIMDGLKKAYAEMKEIEAKRIKEDLQNLEIEMNAKKEFIEKIARCY